MNTLLTIGIIAGLAAVILSMIGFHLALREEDEQ